MTTEEIDDLKSDYMVCQCYEVTFGDIVEAIENGYNSVDGLIYETRAGYGCERCQSRRYDLERDRDIHLDEILEYIKIKSFSTN
jgi:NAD(P)H-nitrite reductase large subunit